MEADELVVRPPAAEAFAAQCQYRLVLGTAANLPLRMSLARQAGTEVAS